MERGDAQAPAGAILQLLPTRDSVSRRPRRLRARLLTMFIWDRIAEDLLKEYERLFAPGDLRQVFVQKTFAGP